jgi:hypothetical protein
VALIKRPAEFYPPERFGMTGVTFFVVRLKFQKRSALKFVSRTIPRSGGYNTPKLALGFIPAIVSNDRNNRVKFAVFTQKALPV